MRTVAGLLFAVAIVNAQTPPQLEVASIKPSIADRNSTSGIYTGEGGIDAHNVTLKRSIIGAYRIGPNEIVGGPDWLDEDRFDILAKAEQSTNGDAVLMDMLQTLLADRFKLKLHRETRTMTAYVLEVGKNGPKLEKAENGEASTNSSNSNGRASIEARASSMDRLARTLARSVDLPVVNRTGLDGNFNFKLQWTPQQSQPSNRPDDVSIFTAIQEQLGLRLRSEKVPVEVLVIDSAEKPSAN
jgi:uncharacterized protein (TIGR03435 family)